MSGVVSGSYAWLDTADPAPPGASKITVTDLEGWRARVAGAAGSVASASPVLVSCLDLPTSVLVTSRSTGSFTADL